MHEVLHSPGQPLDAETRAFFEPRFGHDFSRVRVHTDVKAAESARAVNALAYTVEHDVVFGAGQYAPHAVVGKRLLAHELAHVFQQSGGTLVQHSTLHMNQPGDSAEQAAENTAHQVLAPVQQDAAPVRRALLTCHPFTCGLMQRRTIRQEYSTTETEYGPLCDVTLTISGAPESDSESLTEFIDAAMDGVRGACGTFGGEARRHLRVKLPYRRGLNHGQISDQAYIAARVSVLGPSAIPPTAEQMHERARIAALTVNYEHAVDSGNWTVAAEFLNAFNDVDINANLRALRGLQLPQMRRGATHSMALGGGNRLTAAIDGINPDARRVAELLDQYDQARQDRNWPRASELLNAFNDNDILTLLSHLLPSELSSLRAGALRDPILSGAARLTGLIDAAVGAPPKSAIGLICFDGEIVTASKNGRTQSCDAITSSDAPTPNGRYCVRPQGEAQRRAWFKTIVGHSRHNWFLLEPQFATTRFRMDLHPGSISAGCVTVTDSRCFDQLASVLNEPGLDTATGYDGYPPGNERGVKNSPRQVECVAWLDVTSTRRGCRR